jgi:hypothetical protein
VTWLFILSFFFSSKALSLPENSTVSVAFAPFYATIPLKQKKLSAWFRDAGLHVELVPPASSLPELLSSEDIDVISSPLTPELIEWLTVLGKYRIAGSMNLRKINKAQYQVVLRKDITLAPDRPLRIAVHDGRRSPDYLFLRHWLQTQDPALRPWVMNMSPRETAVAIRRNFLEGAVVANPDLSGLKTSLQNDTTVAYSDAESIRQEVTFLLFSEKFTSQRRRQAKDFLNTFNRWLVRGGIGDGNLDKDFIRLRLATYAKLHLIAQTPAMKDLVNDEFLSFR